MPTIMTDDELGRMAQRFYEVASEHDTEIIFTSMLVKPVIVEALQAALELVMVDKAEYPWAVENRVVPGPALALFRHREDAYMLADQFIDLRVIKAPATRGERTGEPTFGQTDALARKFHDEYERLAPLYGYKTRKASAVPWEDVPSANKELMRAVARVILVDTDITK